MKVLLAAGLVASAMAHPHGPAEDVKDNCYSFAQAQCPEYVEAGNLAGIFSCMKMYDLDFYDFECAASISRNYPALFECAEDVYTTCPTVSNFKCGHGDRDEDDDEGHRHHGRHHHGHHRNHDREEDETDVVAEHFRRIEHDSHNTEVRCLAANWQNYTIKCRASIQAQWNTISADLELPDGSQPLPSDLYHMFSVEPEPHWWGKYRVWVYVAIPIIALLLCASIFWLYRCTKGRHARRNLRISRAEAVNQTPDLTYTGAGSYQPMAPDAVMVHAHNPSAYAAPVATPTNYAGTIPVATPI